MLAQRDLLFEQRDIDLLRCSPDQHHLRDEVMKTLMEKLQVACGIFSPHPTTYYEQGRVITHDLVYSPVSADERPDHPT